MESLEKQKQKYFDSSFTIIGEKQLGLGAPINAYAKLQKEKYAAFILSRFFSTTKTFPN